MVGKLDSGDIKLRFPNNQGHKSNILDIPKFKTYPKPSRYLFPKIILLVFLGALLYSGIYLNYWIASKEIPEVLNYMFIAGILILLVLQVILNYVKYAQFSYIFYDQHVELHEIKQTEIYYPSIRKISFHQSLIDRLFKTSTIIIEYESDSIKKSRIRNITIGNQVYFFLQKMTNSKLD